MRPFGTSQNFLAVLHPPSILLPWNAIAFIPTARLFYVTFTIVDWLPVFVSAEACQIVTESLLYCHQHKGLRVNAYVIMPTHMHGIFFHESFTAKALELTLTDFRKFTGRRAADFSAKHLPRAFSQVFEEKSGADRERRFWQPSRHPVQLETEAFWRAKLGLSA